MSALGWLLRTLLKLVIGLVGFSLVWAIAYRWINPGLTWPMARDALHGQHVERDWTPLNRISPAVPRAAIGAEDAKFCSHNGFDMGAMEAAMAKNAESTKLRGGSTISQQTAKNAFLWPERSYLRKGLEAYFTVLIEAFWGKRRIMEVYLNIAEMGPGIYGVGAAAQHYFGVSAAQLSPKQAARLVAILPQPIKRDASDLHGKVKRHARAIERRIRVVRDGAIDGCLAG
ncbi:monofunctional biosynthetic peptidoglycan transglycosylase [Glacieibacterium sp.]|uniref:monofunctional biosynthetic peptidoglycan transglycosylase n=1 Tax=Glacieibacterium sp. TaxID=2860237 RepID=UPI003AFFC4C4